MIRPIEVRAQRQIYKNGWIEVLFIGQCDNPDMVAVAEPLKFTEKVNNYYIDEPTMRLRPDEAQQLMDELWCCGLRPTEGTGSLRQFLFKRMA